VSYIQLQITFDKREEAVSLAKTMLPMDKFPNSYKCPQIIATDLTHGSQDYFDWITENTK